MISLEQRIELLEKEILELKEKVHKLEGNNNINIARENQYQRPKVYTPVQKKPVVMEHKKKQNIIFSEGNIGKNITGILASLLIFIGLISLIVLIYDKLNDIQKVIGMFIFSGLLTTFGVIISLKKKNAFTLSLAGCGLGALFLSTLVSNIVFGIFGKITVYCLLYIWMLAVIFISQKLKSSMLNGISLLGICIAIIFGLQYQSNITEVIMLSIFSISSLAIIDIVNIKSQNSRSSIIALLTTLLIYICIINSNYYLSVFDWYKGIYSIMLTQQIIIFLLTFGVFIWYLGKNCILSRENSIYALIGGALFAAGLIALFETVLYANTNKLMLEVIPLLVIAALYLATALFKPIRHDRSMLILPSLLYLTFLLPTIISTISNNSIEVTGYIIISLILLADGYYNKNKLLKIFANILFYVDLLIAGIYGFSESYISIDIIYFIFFLAFIGADLYIDKKQSSKHLDINKILKYLALNFITIALLGNIDNILFYRKVNGFINTKFMYFGELALIICAIFNILAIQTGYIYDWKNEGIRLYGNKNKVPLDRNVNIVISICSMIIYVIGLSWLFGSYNNPLIISLLVILVLTIIGLMRTAEILNKYKSTVWVGPYIVTKLGILIIAICNLGINFDKYQFVLSLILLVIAFASIILGFKFEIKSMRLYGLFLSIVSVLKVACVDIYGVNSIQRVIAFITGGLICFAISAIYNKIDKDTNIATK